jgi:choline kinase
LRAVIIAAGRGSRLETHSSELPKSLITVGHRSIIETILLNLTAVGVNDAVIVTGYKHDILIGHLQGVRDPAPKIRFVHNDQWEKRNGVSVLCAESQFGRREEFLLMMSDHLFEVEILRNLMSFQLGGEEVALAVDDRVDSVFDIDDATKVFVEDSHIREIGKTLLRYNGIDTGLFKCTTALFDSLREAMDANNDCSLTDGGVLLARKGKMRAVPTGGHFWIDIDTPESLHHAVRNIPVLKGYEGP